MRPGGVIPLLLLLAAPLAGQEEATAPSRFAAAGWCVVISQEGPAEEVEAEEEGIGCDVGIGLSLFRHKRLAWVAVIGSKSAGTGIAWVIPGMAPVVAIAVGIIAPYDSAGLRADPQLALGATLSFRGGE